MVKDPKQIKIVLLMSLIVLAGLGLIVKSTNANWNKSISMLNNSITAGNWNDDENHNLDDQADAPTGEVVINEIMWMGTIGLNPEGKPIPEGTDEFIELYNTTNQDINIGNWTITNGKAGNNDLIIPADSIIKAQSYYLITRRDVVDSNFISNRDSVQSMSLQQNYHANGQLVLLSESKVETDATPVITGKPQAWSAGKDELGQNPYRASMMRSDPLILGTDEANWHTCNIEMMTDDEQTEMKSHWREEAQPYNCGTPGNANLSTTNIPLGGSMLLIDLVNTALNGDTDDEDKTNEEQEESEKEEDFDESNSDSSDALEENKEPLDDPDLTETEIEDEDTGESDERDDNADEKVNEDENDEENDDETMDEDESDENDQIENETEDDENQIDS